MFSLRSKIVPAAKVRAAEKDENAKKEKKPATTHHSSARDHALAAFAATEVEVLLTYPLNVLLKIQQHRGVPFTTAFKSLTQNGLSGLYRGIGTALFTAGLARATSFGLGGYYRSSSWMPKAMPEFAKQFLSSALAASTQPIIISPLDNMKTLLQTRPKGYENLSAVGVAAKIFQDRGLKGFWRGTTSSIQRNAIYMPIWQASRRQAQLWLPAATTETGRAVRDFASGSIGSFVAQFVTFPLQVARTMSQTGDARGGLFGTLGRLYQEGGIARIYAGFGPAFVMSLFTGGIFTAVEGAALRALDQAHRLGGIPKVPLLTVRATVPAVFTASAAAAKKKGSECCKKYKCSCGKW